MSTGDVKIVVTLDSTGAQAKIETLDKTLRDLQNQTGQNRTAAKSFGEQLMTGLIPQFTAASLAADAIKDGLRFIKGQLSDMMTEALESEQSQHRLATALEMTGRASIGTVDDLRAFAQAQMEATVYTDEEVQSVMTLLAQLTKLDAEGIKKATKGAMGLATVMGMDLQSAATMVTKAMEGHTEALGRVGIVIDDSIPKHEQAAAVLDKLIALYPRATAELETMGGQIKNAAKNWKEFLEGWGKSVLSTPQMQATIQALSELSKWIAKTSESSMTMEEAARQVEARFRGVELAAKPTKEALAEMNAGIAQVAEGLIAAADASDDLDPRWGQLNEELTALPKGFTSLAEGQKTATEWLAKFAQMIDQTEANWKRAQERNIDLLNTYAAIAEIDPESIFPVIDQGLITSPILDDLWSIPDVARAASAETASVWDLAMQSMTSGLVSFGDANATVFANVGKVFGNFVKSAISGIEALTLKEMIAAHAAIAANQAQSQSEAVKWIMKTIPWPFSLIAAAGSFAVVNAIFSKILKFDQGGFADKPTLAVVGHGPEYMLPERKLERLIERTVIETRGGGGRGGGPQVFSPIVNIHVVERLDKQEIRRLGPEILQSIKSAAEGTGYAWGRA